MTQEEKDKKSGEIIKKRDEIKRRSDCLDRALNLYGASRYTAGEVKVAKPDEVISAARKFYMYIVSEDEAFKCTV